MNYYKAVKAMEQTVPENPPLYDSDAGKSTDTSSKVSYMPTDENELVRALYSRINSVLYPFITEVVDCYDYNGSPIYDEDGISRETLAQLVSKVLDKAQEYFDEVDEILLTVSARQITASGGWSPVTLLNAAVEALILNNIFMYRRPRMRAIYNSYSFKQGKYNGLNYA